MWECLKKAPHAAIAWYMMLSWLYYQHDISLVPDHDYDQLCKHIMLHWDELDHPHKRFIHLDDLKAGTGYALSDYPEMSQDAAFSLAIKDKHLKWNKKRSLWVKAS